MAVRAIRGATQLERDDPDEMREAVTELVSAMLEENALTSDSIISVLFTSTPDLVSQFPAAAARHLELADVPLLCAREIDVPGALPRVVRVLAHVETPAPRPAVKHVYKRGAQALRPDLSA